MSYIKVDIVPSRYQNKLGIAEALNNDVVVGMGC